MRHEMTGIMVGAGTVIADDPMLNCRLPQTKDPVRIVCDTTLRIPLKSRIVQTAEEQNTIIATCCQDEAKIREYQKYGCRIIVTEHADGKVDLKELMRQLGADGIESVLLEGGAMLNWSALEAGIVNEVYAYVAPKLFGGADAKSPVAGMGVDHPDDAYCLVSHLAVKYRVVAEDGHSLGGPFYYIEKGMGSKWKWLAKIFAFFGVCVGLFGIGTFSQVNGISSAVQNFFDPNKSNCVNIPFLGEYSWAVVISSLILAACVAAILIGGLKRSQQSARLLYHLWQLFI